VNPEPNPDAEPGNPLYGQTVVFTGQLHGRPEAKQRSAEFGARPESRVTGRTTVLVVGDGFMASDLRSGRLTGKAKRVLELHDRGQAIEVIFPRASSCRWWAVSPEPSAPEPRPARVHVAQ
jgi:DNA polymerase-3 subunit epsilon